MPLQIVVVNDIIVVVTKNKFSCTQKKITLRIVSAVSASKNLVWDNRFYIKLSAVSARSYVLRHYRPAQKANATELIT